jgi:hypothetical protein
MPELIDLDHVLLTPDGFDAWNAAAAPSPSCCPLHIPQVASR